MTKPWALVIGDLSLVRALGRMHIPVAVASSTPLSPPASSRYCTEVVATPSFVDDPKGAVDAVIAWSRRQAQRPVIFYQGDHDLLALSRARDRVMEHAHLVMPDAELVEDLVDKLRFAGLARRLGLPVPRTLLLRRRDADHLDTRGIAAVGDAGALRDIDDWASFPCVLKPSMRTHWMDWELHRRGERPGKALRIETRAELERIVPLALSNESDCVLQAAVEGGEEHILSYHAYVRPDGAIAAELTGRKVRTTPLRYGFSTCVMVAHEPEVLFAGRDIVRALSFTGVLKMDFKRDVRDGRLYLLEINPRFNLWHHAATVAGVAIPSMVYDDCVGPRIRLSPPATARMKREVVWMNARGDARAALEHVRAGQLSIRQWFRELLDADVREDVYLRDPVPFFVELASRALSALGPAR